MTPKVHAALLALVSMTANAPECLLGTAASSLGAASGETGEAAPSPTPMSSGGTFATIEGSDIAGAIAGGAIAEWLDGAGIGYPNEPNPERTAWSQFEFSTLDLSYEMPVRFGGAEPYAGDALFAFEQLSGAMPIGSYPTGSSPGLTGGSPGRSGGGKGTTESPADSGSGPDTGTPGATNPAGPAGGDLPGDDLPGVDDDSPSVDDDSPSDDSVPGDSAPPKGSAPPETSLPDEPPQDKRLPDENSQPPGDSLPPEGTNPTNEHPVSVPEPASLGLFGFGLLGLGLFRRGPRKPLSQGHVRAA